MKVPRKLAAAWRAKLARSGFQDLESTDRDGPLSDRGNLHPIEETQEEHEAMAWRATTGGEYYRWARDVLHTRRFRSATERKAWELHANGDGLREIAQALGLTYHDARDLVNGIKARRSKQSNQSKETHQWRVARKPYRALTWDTSVKLAALLVKMLMPSSTRPWPSSGPTSRASSTGRGVAHGRSTSSRPRRSPGTSAPSVASPGPATDAARASSGS